MCGGRGGNPRQGYRLYRQGEFRRRARSEKGRSVVRDRSAAIPGGIGPRPRRVDSTKGRAGKGEADLARSNRLRPSGAISEDEYEQHVAQLAIAKASIQEAEAAVRDAQLNLEFTKVVSPIDGRVSRARITEGNLVQPGTGDTMVLTKVVTVDPIYVYFNIDESALLKYVDRKWQSGDAAHPSRIKDQDISVEIALAKDDGFPYKGVLDFIDNQVDSKTGTIPPAAIWTTPSNT